MPLYITISAALVTTLTCWRVDWNTYILCFSHGCYRTFSTETFFFHSAPYIYWVGRFHSLELYWMCVVQLVIRVSCWEVCPVSVCPALGVSSWEVCPASVCPTGCVSSFRSVQLGGVSYFCVSYQLCVQLEVCPAGRCVLLLCVQGLCVPPGSVLLEVCPNGESV